MKTGANRWKRGGGQMQQDPHNIAAGSGAISVKSLSRRQILDRCVGLGALFLMSSSARAGHATHGNTDMSDHMDMSPALGMVPDRVVPATDQQLVEPEVRRSANGVLSTTPRVGYAYRQIGGVRLYVRSY